MKKLLLVICTFFLFILISCSNKNQKINLKSGINENASSVVNNNDEERIAVVYFSVTSNTKKVAEKIDKYLVSNNKKSMLVEIIPAVPYKEEDLGFDDPNNRTRKEYNDKNIRPEIIDANADYSSCNTIFLGYPIWLGTSPNIIYTFLEKNDLEGKTIIPFCTSEGSGISDSVANIKNYTKAIVEKGRRFAIDSKDEEIRDWLKELGY